MDPFSVAGLGLEVLGIGAKTIKWIKNTVSKKVLVTPSEVTVNTKHWDSSSSVIIQNTTDRPLFNLQVICWFEDGQIVEFKPHHMENPQSIAGNITIDSAVFVVTILTKDKRSLHLLNLGRLLPRESLEVELQIKGRGKVRFLPTSYSTKDSKQILNDGRQVAMPFEVPPGAKLLATGIWIKKTT